MAGFNFIDPLGTGLDVGGLGDPSSMGGGGLPGMDMLGGMGGMFGGGGSVFGTKPIVPDFTPTNAQDEQATAISGDLKSFKNASKLSGQVNTFNQSELLRMNAAAIPQFQAMMQAGSQRSMDLLTNQSFADMLAGKIPKDVQDQVQNSAAAKAVGGGYGGSQMHANLVARDLGLTSLDLIQKGAQLTEKSIGSAEQWMLDSKSLSVPGLHNVASMFVTPEQQITNTRANNAAQWTRDYTAALVAAAPDPAARGAYDTAMGLTSMVLSAYSGGNRYQAQPTTWPGGGGSPPPAGSSGNPYNGWNSPGNTSYLPDNSAPSQIDYGAESNSPDLAGAGGLFGGG